MLKDNLTEIFENIKNGNNLGEKITLVGAIKTVGVDTVNEAIGLGLKIVGDNKVQEFKEKSPFIRGADFQFIGHLQTNKVKKIIDKVSLIHSLDRWPLAETISRAACEAGITAKALIQVNITGETTKYGLSPVEAEGFARAAAALPGLELCGLMTIAPACDDPEEVRYVFQQAVVLNRKIKDNIQGIKMDILSMGMTSDFEIALEEGANLIRLGTALFGTRS